MIFHQFWPHLPQFLWILSLILSRVSNCFLVQLGWFSSPFLIIGFCSIFDWNSSHFMNPFNLTHSSPGQTLINEFICDFVEIGNNFGHFCAFDHWRLVLVLSWLVYWRLEWLFQSCFPRYDQTGTLLVWRSNFKHSSG